MARVRCDLHVALQRPLSCGLIDQLHGKMTIGALPDDVLLDIFNFFVHLRQPPYPISTLDDASSDKWYTLIHVCQRWRYAVLASPRSLNLRLYCTNRTPASAMLDIWPAFPIVVFCQRLPRSPLRGMRNIIAALKCRDRVCEIYLLGVPHSLLKRFAALKAPFPELKSIRLSSSENEWTPGLPDSFLGGFAPRLRSLELYGIPFPAPQKLLSSTKDLVTLRLEDIPDSGYISPEEMARLFSALTKLEQVALGFRLTQLHWLFSGQHPPLLSRTVLPALTSFRFRGDCTYLETLILQIDLPLLDNLDMTFFQPVPNAPHLREFISRIEAFEAHHRADLAIYDRFVNVTLSRPEGMATCGALKLGVLCERPYYEQFSSLVQLCTLSLHFLSTLEHLHIHGSFSLHYWQDYYPDNTKWLELLHPFTSVKNLHVSEKLALRVMRALKELSSGGVMEVLPALENIFLPGSQLSVPIAETNVQFVAARGRSGRSVLVHYK